ncbi:MAG: type IV pilin protein [Pseudomonadota bacterium]
MIQASTLYRATGDRGFTLVELVIAVAVLAIIVAIAIPSYGRYVVETNRGEGKVAINNAAQALERCYSRFSRYNAGGCTVTFPIASENNWYSVTAVLDATTYTLTAAPQNSQATNDAECANLTLTHTGVRGISGTGTVGDCW